MKPIKPKIQSSRKVKASQSAEVISTSLQEEFLRFMENHPANRFNRNLRKMLLEFLMQDDAVEAFYLKDLLYDLEGLFDLLDSIEAEEMSLTDKLSERRFID